MGRREPYPESTEGHHTSNTIQPFTTRPPTPASRMTTLTYVTLLTVVVMVQGCSRSCPPEGDRRPRPGNDGPFAGPSQTGPTLEESRLPDFWSRPHPNFLICRAFYTDWTPDCNADNRCPNGMTCRHGPETLDRSRPTYSYCFPEPGPHQGPPPPPPFICALRFPGENAVIERKCPSDLVCPDSFSRPPPGSSTDYEFKICKKELCRPQRPSK